MDKKTIFVADNQKINPDLLEKYLEGVAGYKVIVTKENTTAIEQVKRHRPDAVIMDIVMPDLQGDEIAHRLKNDPKTSRVPVILITADILQENDGSEADYFLRRPMIGENLLKILSDIFLHHKIYLHAFVPD